MYNDTHYSLLEILTNDLQPQKLFSTVTIIFFLFLIVFLILNHIEKEQAKEKQEEIAKIKKEITDICWPQWSKSENYITDIDRLNKKE